MATEPAETFEEYWERVKPDHPPIDEALAATAAVIRRHREAKAAAKRRTPAA